MSRGLGKVQWGCLTAIWQYERDGYLPTTYDIAADVYHVERDKDDGYRYVTDAQHVAVKRALEGWQRKGRIIGFRDVVHAPEGDGRIELCHCWMTEKGLAKWLAKLQEEIERTCMMRLNPQFSIALRDRV
jgi:hypothetical protein